MAGSRIYEGPFTCPFCQRAVHIDWGPYSRRLAATVLGGQAHLQLRNARVRVEHDGSTCERFRKLSWHEYLTEVKKAKAN